MAIELVQVDEMRTGRGGGGRKSAGQKYPKYRAAIAKTLPWLKEQVEERGTIRVKLTDVAREMGKEFETKHPTSIAWALKYTLFNEGIWVSPGKTTEDEHVLVMRAATPEDKLPSSLDKFNKPKEGLGKEEPGEEEPEEDLKEEDE